MTQVFLLDTLAKDKEIPTLRWSGDSRSLLALSVHHVHIFSLDAPARKVHITNGSGALGRIVTADVLAGGNAALVVWEFGRLGHWDLATGRLVEIGNVKLGGLPSVKAGVALRAIEGRAEGES